MTTEELRVAALSLPIEERAGLAYEIIRSLDGVTEEGAGEAWAAEIDRRAREVREGKVDLVDGDEVHRRIREKLAARRR